MIRIAQASSSENFTKYGKAPNQRRTGADRAKPEGNLDGELNVVNWYGGWEAVYRAIDAEVAERIATFMYRAVANGNYFGYSWSGNTEAWDALHAIGSTDPMDVVTPVNCDCATLVGAAVDAAGIRDSGLRAMVTWKEDEVLMRTNAFIKLTDTAMLNNGTGIRRGDILWKTGHTAVALDSDPVAPSGQMIYFQKHTFKNTAISAGTVGTRAAQLSKGISMPGYRPIVARLASVSNSALCNVVPFLGGGKENKLYVNYYRAQGGTSGTIDAEVMVVYVRNDISAP